jgi:hypothetical protein
MFGFSVLAISISFVLQFQIERAVGIFFDLLLLVMLQFLVQQKAGRWALRSPYGRRRRLPRSSLCGAYPDSKADTDNASSKWFLPKWPVT